LFPSYQPAAYKLLDQAHAKLKDAFVASGLMLAEFYPGSQIGSKHNQELPVYNAPHACMAIRYMASHDILFVGDNRDWFLVYHKNFRTFWDKKHPETFDHLKTLYDAAVKKFAPDDRS
jgi:hypothetical protein